MRIISIRQAIANRFHHFTRRAAWLLAAGCVLLAIPAGAQIGEPTPGAYTNMLAQISALKAEAAALTPAQKKLSSTLMEAVREHRGIGPRKFAPHLHSSLKPLAGGRMLVDIKAKVSAELLKTIRSLGGTVEGSFPQYNAVQAEVPLDVLETIANSPEVISIRSLLRPRTNAGTATSEGDVAHQANVVRSTYGVTGAGVKVGVMSDSDRYITASQTSGDLGQVTVLDSGQGIGNDTGEGTAMLEIVHDLAPDAQLYFASGERSEEAMSSNIVALADAGCSIIIDDLTYADEPPFQDGIISQAVQKVSDRGVLYFSSAANIGNFDSGTASVWEGDFAINSVNDPRYGAGPLHNWGGSVYNLLTNLPAGGADVTLDWADPLGARANIYNLFVTDNSGNILGTGLSYDNGPKDPIIVIESVTNRPGGQYLVVEMAAASSPVYIRVDVDQDNCKLGYGTPGSTRGHNASPAPNAFCVAATTAEKRTTAFTAGTESVEKFSCDGYRRMFFYSDGTPITGGNYSSSGGQVFFKPDITAADGVLASTGTFPSNSLFSSPFFGTSAAAPHAGAIAALLKSYRPGLDAGSIRAALVTSALDIGATGSDRDSGAGIVMANRAMSSLLDTNSPVATITYPLNGSTITASGFAPFAGTAVESPSGVASVTGILTYDDPDQGYLYWNGTAFQTDSATLTATLNGTNWTINNLPSGGNFKNGSYAFSVSAASGTVPPVVGTAVIVTFMVDYHQIYTWTAGSYYQNPPNSNPNNDWFNPENWDLDSVPSSDSFAVIGSASPSPASDSAINIYGLGLSAGSLTTPSLAVSQLILENGALAVTDLAINSGGVFDWEGGSFSGACRIPASASLNFDNPMDIFLSPATIINSTGTITWSGAGNLDVANGGVITSGGTFDIQTDAQVLNYTGGTFTFINNGALIKTAGTNTIFRPDNSGVTLINYGTISSQSGILALGGGGWASNSLFTAATGCHIDLTAGAMEFDATNNFSGGGSIRVNGGTLTLGGTNTLSGGGTFEVLAGSLDGAGTFVGTGAFNWTGGAIGGDLNLHSPSISFNIGGATDKTLAPGTLTSLGSGIWNGSGTLNVTSASTLVNDGTLNIQSDAEVFNSTGGTSTFINNGTLLKTAGANTLFRPDNTGMGFNNNGILNVQSGILSLGGGGTGSNGLFTAAAGCHIDLTAGSAEWDGNMGFSGTGSTRVNGGTLTFGGGTSTLSGGGTVEVLAGSLGGAETFVGTGAFNWTGGTIGGDLNLNATNISFNIGGATDKTLAPGTLTSLGSGIWNGSGTLNVTSASTLVNDGTLNIQSDAEVFNSTGGTSTFINNGTLLKTAGANTLFRPDNTGMGFNNNGILNVQSGTLSLGGGGIGSNGLFTAAAGCHIDLTAGSAEWDGNMGFSGTGSTRVNGGTLTLGGGTSTLSGGGTVEVLTGSLGGAETFVGTGVFNWTGGTIGGDLNLNATNISFNIGGATDKTLAPGTLTSLGSGIWNGSGTLNVTSASTLVNDGTLNIQSDAEVFNSTGGTSTFINNGTLLKTAGANTLFRPDNTGMGFNNNGILNVQSGILSLGGGGTGSNGLFTAAAGCHIDLTAGSAEWDGNMGFSGTGSTRVNGGTLTLGGGTSTLSGGGTVEVLTGSLGGAETFVGTGVFNWTGGAIGGNLNLHSPSISFNIGGATDKTLAPGTLTSLGSGIWNGSGTLNVTSASTLVNDGTLNIQSDAEVFNSTGGISTFVNNGTLLKTAGANTLFRPDNTGMAFNNNGMVNLQSGALTLDAGYTPASGSQLSVALGGVAPGIQYSHEDLGQAVALAGTLNVSLKNGFTPTNGQSFDIVHYTSNAGQFSAMSLPSLPGGLNWQAAYGDTALTLTVVRQVAISSAKHLTNGHFQFTLGGPNRSSLMILGSTNLTAWLPLLTNTPFNGALLFDDPSAVGYKERFYKVMITP